MIDAYDVLGIKLNAGPEDIKKAFRRLSLQHHPDKLLASNSAVSATRRFDEIKDAYDTLQDVDRRRVYDAFGVDLGSESPVQFVWSLGVSTLVVPVGVFMMKTVVAQTARWLVGFSWVRLGVLFCSAGAMALSTRSRSLELGSLHIRKPAPLLINLGVTAGLVVVHFVWPVLFDSACILYLTSEVVGVEALTHVGPGAFGGVVAGCFALAWLVRRWWVWIIGLSAALSGVALLASCVASVVLRQYIDSIEIQHSAQVKAQRQLLRSERQRLTDEVARLREQVQAQLRAR